MKEFKGTKGNWEVLDLDDIFIRSENGQQVLRIESNGFNSNAKANAQLIAAAPDLLEALQFLLMDLEERGNHMQSDAIKIAKQAISKALDL